MARNPYQYNTNITLCLANERMWIKSDTIYTTQGFSNNLLSHKMTFITQLMVKVSQILDQGTRFSTTLGPGCYQAFWTVERLLIFEMTARSLGPPCLGFSPGLAAVYPFPSMLNR